MKSRFYITDELWETIEPICLGKSSDRGRTGTDNRLFVEAVVHVARTGVPWRDLPREFGNWNTIYKRFARWQEAGVMEKIYEEVARGGDFELVAFDSTIVKVHKHAQGAKKKRATKGSVGLAEAQPQRSTH